MNAIEIRNVSKHFKDFSIEDLNFELPKGCICGLVGENGAGKSTTIRLIMRALRPDGGTIRVLGTDNAAPEFQQVKEDVGVVLDEAHFPETLNAQQVGSILRDTYARWDAAMYDGYLKRFGLPPKKLFRDYSRGMTMKLAIAAALSHAPKLLILDEATSGLDPIVRDEILDIFSDFTRDAERSVLISSHIVSDLEKLCDTIAFLHKGKLLLCEDKDTLREEYALWHGTAGQLEELDKNAIVSRRVTAYGAEALVKRELVPAGSTLTPVSIEELFVLMVKGENVR